MTNSSAVFYCPCSDRENSNFNTFAYRTSISIVVQRCPSPSIGWNSFVFRRGKTDTQAIPRTKQYQIGIQYQIRENCVRVPLRACAKSCHHYRHRTHNVSAKHAQMMSIAPTSINYT